MDGLTCKEIQYVNSKEIWKQFLGCLKVLNRKHLRMIDTILFQIKCILLMAFRWKYRQQILFIIDRIDQKKEIIEKGYIYYIVSYK